MVPKISFRLNFSFRGLRWNLTPLFRVLESI
jgi:hypothetical protein